MRRTRSRRSCNFELQIVHLCRSLPLPSCLALLSIEAGKYLHWVSRCDGACWWLPLSGLPWIPGHPARGSHLAWHHPLTGAPLPSSSIGKEFNASALLLSSCIEIPMQRDIQITSSVLNIPMDTPPSLLKLCTRYLTGLLPSAGV